MGGEARSLAMSKADAAAQERENGAWTRAWAVEWYLEAVWK